MAVESAMYEIVAAVLSPAEQRDVFHDLCWSRDRTFLSSQLFTMPVVVVDKADLWERLGRDYSNVIFVVKARFNQ